VSLLDAFGEVLFSVTVESRNPWDAIKEQLRSQLSSESFENWISRTRYSGVHGKILQVLAPDQQTAAYLRDEYTPKIDGLVRSLGLGLEAVIFASDGSGGGRKEELGTEFESPVSLNPKFTFDNFVVGSCNQLAHAAAQAVSKEPARLYNPLYLYGGVGMGKTHLMHAIGRSLIGLGKLRIIYTTSERFTNEVVSGIKHGRMAELRARYRTADVLLVDDIQTLANKTSTQEEFFHTFNELHDAQKQIILSSDCPPKEIDGLVDRLRSRFEWGLMADILPPDLETRMAILFKKAENDGVDLPADVCTFVADKTKSNVRELEGALTKLVAYSTLMKMPITSTMARQVLRHLSEKQERRITIEAVQKAVAERFQIKPAQLKEKSNRKEVVEPRQIAMYLAKELTHASLPEIGRAFGGKHHTTVIHSINKIEQQKLRDPELNKTVNNLFDSFN
jgi:chromosomal replication initiator protein